METEYRWIPEAPDFPGLYAVRDECRDSGLRPRGKIIDLSGVVATYTAHDARFFATEEECAEWCADNPHPVFVPRMHGFWGAERSGVSISDC